MARISAFIRRVLGHSGFRKYSKSTGWILGGRIATMGISFLATLFIARNLGPTNYGQLSYALSVIGIIGFIAPLGLDNILYRELLRSPDRGHSLLGTSLLLKLAAGAATAAVAAVFALVVSTDDVSRILILILAGTFLLTPFQIINFTFLARSEPKYQAISTVVITIILNLLKVAAIVLGKGVIYIALTLLLEPFLYAVAYLYMYQAKVGSVRAWSWDTASGKMLLRDSLPVTLLSSFTFIYARIDQVFIKVMIGTAEVGIYDAAVRLVDVWNFIPGAITTALFPAMVNAYRGSREALVARTRKIGVAFFIAPLALSAVVSILSPFVVHVLYGPAFQESGIVLRIYIWSFVGTSLGILTQTYLTLTNERLLLVMSSFLPMVVNIALNLLWVPSYGVVGAAYATVISYSLVPFSVLFSRARAGTRA